MCKRLRQELIAGHLFKEMENFRLSILTPRFRKMHTSAAIGGRSEAAKVARRFFAVAAREKAAMNELKMMFSKFLPQRNRRDTRTKLRYLSQMIQRNFDE